MANKFVQDTNCKNDDQVRKHTIIVGGTEFEYEFYNDKATEMLSAHADVFDVADDAFVVTG